MRFVDAVPTGEATGLTAEVYRMVAEEFFINGAITSHSAVPELMAGMWCGGRESVLVADRLDRATKEAMSNVLSRRNACPYCEDMTVSLVQAAGERELAGWVSEATVGGDAAADSAPTRSDLPADQRPILEWTEAIAHGEWDTPYPLGAESFPEAVGTVTAFSYIPRFSHVVMDGSPVERPLGVGRLRRSALRLFGHELGLSLAEELEPGRPLDLLPAADPPRDLRWAAGNPRLLRAFSCWTATVDRHAERAVPAPVRRLVEDRVDAWHGEPMPLSRSWVEEEVEGLEPPNRDVARLALLVALSPAQVDESVVEPVLGDDDQPRLVRTLAWAAMTGARRIATGIADANPELSPESPEPPATGEP